MHYTISNVPPVEAADPSLMAETTAVIVAMTGMLAVLVWPALIAFALWLYRSSLVDILKRVRNAKGMGVEVDMRELAESTVEVQTEIIPKAPTQPTAVAQQDKPEEVDKPKEEKTLSVEHVYPGFAASNLVYLDAFQNWIRSEPGSDSTFDALARVNRPSAILFAWGEVEKRIKHLAELVGAPKGPTFGITADLANRGIIRPPLHRLLKDLNRLRNRVAHSDVDLTESDTAQFRESAQTAEAELAELIAEALSLGRNMPPE